MSTLDPQTIVDRADEWVVERSRAVIFSFLVVTVIFAIGLGGISTDSGTEQFTEDDPAQEALDEVDEKFERPFVPDEETTQIVQTAPNVLAKDELVTMLEVQEEFEDREELRVVETRSAASVVARTIDPSATTTDAQIRALESATTSEVEAAVHRAAGDSAFASLLSDDFNRESASASATIAIAEHEVPRGLSEAGGGEGEETALTPIQLRMQAIADGSDGDVRVFGSGIISAELSSVIFDSLLIVVPAAAILILLFLVVAYRDPVDLVLGLVSLAVTVVWTFGFVGLAGIPFTQPLVVIPPLLLAVGIDFGIHAINRYREERVTGRAIHESMRTATDQLLPAFVIVTGTTVIGFAANATNDLAPIRDLGIVAAIGIVFTFLIFGLFLPALKVYTDDARERFGVPTFGVRPIGTAGSAWGGGLTVGVAIARRAPYALLVVVVLTTVAAGWYATGIGTSFSTEDFLPPEQTPEYLDVLPEPFAPRTYTVTETIDFLEENFASSEEDTVIVYVEGSLDEDYALESIQRANQNPPDTFLVQGREARAESIITVIDRYAAVSPEFARLVERSDVDDDGVPDENLEEIYDRLFLSPARAQALEYLTEDRHSAQVVYSVRGSASDRAITDDARDVADRYRFEATATGETVVFQSLAETIYASAVQSLALALAGSAVFLVGVFRALEGRASLGVVNIVPIVVAVALLAGSMRFLDVPFNALTATILAIAIGLGVDYSSHVVHRFADEYGKSDDVFDALDRTVRGTGGALTGSMLTTVSGTGVLVFAITPLLGQFGLVIALSIVYSYLAALVVTPSVIVAWSRFAA
ncbi:efflux RND transporter permease subunit [Halegenticoccus tardaugens]|uniref:efflux RND transporter permease subunit n=1 Tax=Halegenticoccus tardaugens TaxID=2071624 RepID=UPI00100ABC53|nr:MMPL family transporter [Halegenticoccus tardaugens]